MNSKITLCHYANGHEHEITVSIHAAETHLVWHTGTGWQPAPGHEQDHIGPCATTTTTTAPPSTTTTTAPTPPTTVTRTPPTTTPQVHVSVPTDQQYPQEQPELPATGFEPGLLGVAALAIAFGLWLRKAARR